VPQAPARGGCVSRKRLARKGKNFFLKNEARMRNIFDKKKRIKKQKTAKTKNRLLFCLK